MFVRIPSASSSRWGRFSLVLGLGLAPVFASCASSEDTEPLVPAMRGATQPNGSGDLVSEDEACERLRSAALAAYEDLRCAEPDYPECPGFLRPGGGSGCYEYREGSVASCEREYEDATSCSNLVPCFATAELNLELPTCEHVVPEGAAGAGGSGGGAAGGEAGGASAGGQGGAPIAEGGSPGVAGQAPQAGAAGDASGGAPP